MNGEKMENWGKLKLVLTREAQNRLNTNKTTHYQFDISDRRALFLDERFRHHGSNSGCGELTMFRNGETVILFRFIMALPT